MQSPVMVTAHTAEGTNAVQPKLAHTNVVPVPSGSGFSSNDAVLSPAVGSRADTGPSECTGATVNGELNFNGRSHWHLCTSLAAVLAAEDTGVGANSSAGGGLMTDTRARLTSEKVASGAGGNACSIVVV